MMMSEFVERTGFHPTAEEYAKIEEDYYHFEGNKDQFCARWVKDGEAQRLTDDRARTIEKLRSDMLEIEKHLMGEIAKADREIDRLKSELDKELEWKPSTGTGTNMSQERYEKLAKSGKVMTDEEAKAFIAEECGFSAEKIHIVHEVSAYEVNKYRRLRKSATYDRVPVYESTDWNYVRFDCAQFMYELENGELRFYCC